jgi:cell division protein FtsB
MSSPALALRSRMPRVAGAALERARLTVVPRRRRRTSSPVPFLLLVSMVAVGGVVGLLLFNTSMQQASFAATSLQQQADNLTAQQQSLEMQLDKLRNPQLIALRAQRMGMVLPSSPAVIRLSDGKVLGVPTPATRLDPLRLLAPPPVKPAELDPAAHVTIIHAQSDHASHHGSHHQGANSHENTGSGSQNSGGHGGRQGHHPSTNTHR